MKNNRLIFVSSFLQGLVIMGYEILVPRLIAPFFGGSLYVWAASLVLTMLGLASGYFLAGRLQFKNAGKAAGNTLFIASFLIFFISIFTENVNNLLLGLPLKQGILITALFHLFPVYLALGMISPLLIHVLATSTNISSGKASGKIFACSTVAGIAGSMLTGFYLIPELGVFPTSIVMVLLLISSAIFILLHSDSPKTFSTLKS